MHKHIDLEETHDIRALLPDDTQWLLIRRQDRTSYDKKMENTSATNQECIIKYWVHNDTILFVIVLDDDTTNYTYRYYPGSDYGRQVVVTDRLRKPVVIDIDDEEAGGGRVLPPRYSAYYLYCVCRQLATYRERIKMYALEHLDHVMARLDPLGGDRGSDAAAINTVKEGHLVPLLMHRLMVKLLGGGNNGAGGSCEVIQPGDKVPSAKSWTKNTKKICLIEPVYGVSHQPLKVVLRSGHYYRLFFGHTVVSPAGLVGGRPLRDGVDYVRPALAYVGSHELNVTYDVLNFIEALGKLLLAFGSEGDDTAIKKQLETFFASYLPNKEHQARLYGQHVTGIVQPNIMYAIKLVQLLYPMDSFVRNTAVTTTTSNNNSNVQVIVIDDDDDDDKDPSYGGERYRKSAGGDEARPKEKKPVATKKQSYERELIKRAQDVLNYMRKEYGIVYESPMIVNREELIEAATGGTLRRLLGDMKFVA